MKKKKVLAMITSVALIAIVGIGATLAYLSDKTDPIKNTFTVGNIEIELTEPDWDPEDAKDVTVGAEVSKNPMVTNTGANDAHIVVKVAGMDEMAENGFSSTYGLG